MTHAKYRISWKSSTYQESLLGALIGITSSKWLTYEVLGSAASVIASMIDEIGEHWEDVDDSISTRSTKADGQETTNEVFVVHGRDEGTKEAVARFLTKLGLQPIVLKEQPNEGRTIIEKFEYYASRVGFAIVLCTPDDKGYLKD